MCRYQAFSSQNRTDRLRSNPDRLLRQKSLLKQFTTVPKPKSYVKHIGVSAPL